MVHSMLIKNERTLAEDKLTLKLYAMTCGWLTMPYGFFIAGEQGELAVPVPSYLIDHPKGTVLYDTGLEKTLQSTDPEVVKETLGSLAPYMKVRYLPGEDIAKRLESFDRDPKGIHYLINSHLHFDHCGGNEAIPNARWVIQKREWQSATTPEGIAENRFVPRHYDLGHDRIEIDGEYDLFEDGTITCVPTYGHTPGHQSLRLATDDGIVWLTADACYMRTALERMMLPDAMVVRDADAMMRNFVMFKRLLDAGAVLIFGHDPAQSKTLTDGPIREVTANALREASSAR